MGSFRVYRALYGEWYPLECIGPFRAYGPFKVCGALLGVWDPLRCIGSFRVYGAL